MDLKVFLLAVIFLTEVTGGPINFPGESEGRLAIAQSRLPPGYEEEVRFHHHKIKKKKHRRKKMKHGCHPLLHHHRSNDPEGRTFGLLFGINYYDTDIHVYNGQQGLGQHQGNPCGNEGSGSGLGSHPVTQLLLGGLNPGGINNRPSPGLGSFNPSIGSGSINPSPIKPTNKPTTGDGDDNDEDYDYSDGPGGTPGSNIPSNSVGQGVSNLGSYVSSAPTSFVSSIGSGIRPVFERPERYFDYYFVRPFNRSIKQLVSWF